MLDVRIREIVFNHAKPYGSHMSSIYETVEKLRKKTQTTRNSVCTLS